MRFDLTGCASLLLVSLAVTLAGCRNGIAEQKIGFDLEILNEDGLYGPPDGLRSLHYEFCIPAGSNVRDEVTSIDPSLVCREGRGRVGCRLEERLCLGNTNQKDHKQILRRLAELRYVEKIEQSFFE